MKKIRKMLSFFLSFALILSAFSSIVSGLDLGVPGDNLTWTVEGDTLTISGTGNMMTYQSAGEAPWSRYGYTVKKLVITDGVESISSYAFANMYALETVSIAESVKEIGYSAFLSCGAIKSIKLPSAVTEIPFGTFMYCTSLKSVEMGGNVVSIGDFAFNFCENLVSIVIPASVTSIGGGAFEGCVALYTIFGEAGSYAEEFSNKQGIKFMTPVSTDELASATPADLGDDFFATIHISALNKRISNNGQNNIVASQITTNNDQRWHFVKEDSTNAYSIASKLDERYMGISNLDAALSNVKLTNEKQLFHIYEIRGGYVIAPVGVKDRVVDVNGYDMNVQFYKFGGYNALQIYEFIDVIAPIPPENVMNTGDPVDLGDDFEANINIPALDKAFTNNGAGNVVAGAINGNDSQIWHFVKANDANAYVIASKLDGRYLTVDDINASLSNVRVSSTKQQFNIYSINGKYVIAPVGIGENVVDVNGVDFNVQYWVFSGSNVCQQYDIVKIGEDEDTPADPPEDDTSVDTKDEFYMDNDTETMPNAVEKTTVSDMISALEQKNVIATITDKNGNILDGDSKVGTGAIVKTSDGKEYSVIVKGDVDGTGDVNATDYLSVKMAFCNEIELSGVFYSAADTDGNQIIDATDYVKIKSYFLGNANLYK